METVTPGEDCLDCRNARDGRPSATIQQGAALVQVWACDRHTEELTPAIQNARRVLEIFQAGVQLGLALFPHLFEEGE